MSIETKPFDAARYFTTDDDQVDLISDALESGHAGYIASALGTIAKAHGMSGLAKDTGFSRQTLYNALSEDGNPQLDTVMKVLKALGLKLTVVKEAEAA